MGIGSTVPRARAAVKKVAARQGKHTGGVPWGKRLCLAGWRRVVNHKRVRVAIEVHMPGDIGQRPPFSMPQAPVRGPAAKLQLTTANRLKPKASLASLSLATKQSQALQVPPHAVKTPLQGPNNHFYAHLVRATQVDAHLLSAQVPDFHNPDTFHTQYFILGDAIDTSDVAVLRGMRTIDRDVSQIYVGKELFLAKDYRDEL
ncbi:MAG: hypothetical protein EOO40_12895, partial [Deltaproteobacteria bacterium]